MEVEIKHVTPWGGRTGLDTNADDTRGGINGKHRRQGGQCGDVGQVALHLQVGVQRGGVSRARLLQLHPLLKNLVFPSNPFKISICIVIY